MADQATSELSAAPAQELAPNPPLPQVTTVANPRRIRLTRLAPEVSRSQ